MVALYLDQDWEYSLGFGLVDFVYYYIVVVLVHHRGIHSYLRVVDFIVFVYILVYYLMFDILLLSHYYLYSCLHLYILYYYYYPIQVEVVLVPDDLNLNLLYMVYILINLILYLMLVLVSLLFLVDYLFVFGLMGVLYSIIIVLWGL